MDEVNVEAYESTLVLSNAIQLGVNVTKNIAGNDIATGVGGERFSTEMLSNLFASKLASYIKEGVK